MIRHCGFCYKEIPVDEVKRCGQCLRRAYCSQKCQKKDWKPRRGFHDGKGQGHKDWCGVPSCEEDIDWELSDFDGCDIIAKRRIPPNYRVVIEGFDADSEDYGRKNYNPLRRSMHIRPSCDSNVSNFFDEEYKADIMYSIKEILPGQRLLLNPVGFNHSYDRVSNPDIGSYFYNINSKPYIDSFADARRIKEQRGAVYICPSKCYCRDPEIDNLVKEAKSIYQLINSKQDKEYDSNEEADTNLKLVHKLIENHKKCHFPLMAKYDILNLGCFIAKFRKSTLQYFEKWVTEIIEISDSISHPESRYTANFRKCLMYPNEIKDYCALDKLLPPETKSADKFQTFETNTVSGMPQKQQSQLVPLSKNSTRHCAFCLESIHLSKVKKCGKCLRRAYCNRKCQVADWSCDTYQAAAGGKRKGQDHKKWCGLAYGEEDIDWEVTSLRRKNGFKYGIIARKTIPSGTRIIVEGFGADNNFCPFDDNISASRCLLVNHACYSNAARIFDWRERVMILYATEEINPGEDININMTCKGAENDHYQIYRNPFSFVKQNDKRGALDEPFLKELKAKSTKLSTYMDLYDDPNCFTQRCICCDKSRDALIESNELAYDSLHIWDKKKPYTEIRAAEDWVTISRLLGNLEKLRLSPLGKAQLLNAGFHIAVQMKGQEMHVARDCIKETYEILSPVLHPNSDQLKEVHALLLDTERKQNAESSAENKLASECVQVRHCGYCTVFIPPQSVVLCGKCNRRAYCSEQCQKLDWTSKRGVQTFPKGQGHEDWCEIPYGEEDIDWEVALYIPGKGRGVIAKRFIPAGYRLMVDGYSLKHRHKGWDEMPQELQRAYKYNHSCSANAFHTIDYEFNVMIGYSKRDIQAGEEICTNYFNFNESYDKEFKFSKSSNRIESFEGARMLLLTEHDIICPLDCFCRDPEIDQLVMDGKKRYRNLKIREKFKRATIRYSTVDAKEDLRNIQELLKNSEKIQVAPTDKARLLVLGAMAAGQQKSTLNLGRRYAKDAFELTSAVYHPRSEESKRVEMFAKYDALRTQDLTLNSKRFYFENSNLLDF